MLRRVASSYEEGGRRAQDRNKGLGVRGGMLSWYKAVFEAAAFRFVV